MLVILYDASNSYDSDVGDYIATYNWDYGDNTTGNGKIVTHEYSSFGEHLVRLEVIDSLGDSTSISIIVTTWNDIPHAEAGLNRNIIEGTSLILDGSGSSDPDGIGDIVSYNWDFGDGTTGSGVGVSHTYADEGVYTATLTVMDTAGHTASDTAMVTVNNVVPSVVRVMTPVESVLPGVVVSTGADFSDPGIFDTHIVIFDWGDGNTSVGSVTENGGSGSVSGSHSYGAAGIYTVTMTVMDNDGGSATTATSVTILTPAEATANLIDLVETFNLQQGIENNLDAKLDAAVDALSDLNVQNNVAAINALQAFTNAVEAQRDVKITSIQANKLIAVALQILNSL